MRYISVILLLSILITGCSSSNSVPNEGRIPTKWEGDWVWFRTYGGIGGTTFTPDKVGYTCTLRIGAENALSYVLRNDSVVCSMPYPIVGTTDSTMVIAMKPDSLHDYLKAVVPHVELTGGTSFEMGISVSNDTLMTGPRLGNDMFDSWFIKK